MERVLGIGGFFFRAKDPAALAAWYEANLGIPSAATNWSWHQEPGPTVFTPFAADTDYFGRMDQQVMLNFRVADLDAMLVQLRAAGVAAEQTAHESFGKFGHATNPEETGSSCGNRWRAGQPR